MFNDNFKNGNGHKPRTYILIVDRCLTSRLKGSKETTGNSKDLLKPLCSILESRNYSSSDEEIKNNLSEFALSIWRQVRMITVSYLYCSEILRACRHLLQTKVHGGQELDQFDFEPPASKSENLVS